MTATALAPDPSFRPVARAATIQSWPHLACDPCMHCSPQPRAGQTRVLLTLDAP
jgi:hypothetical protein